MDAVPELRMETENRQSAEYAVHHQKLVRKILGNLEKKGKKLPIDISYSEPYFIFAFPS